jgi:flagellar basal body-associated protein FliL
MKKVKYKNKKKGKPRDKKKLWKTIIIVVVVLGILVGGFFAFNAYQEKRDLESMRYGFNIGYSQAIIQLMNMSLSCQPVPLYAGNSTIEVIAVDCLQQQTQQ